MKRKNPLLSIIIPTLNEEKYLPNLLRSIKKQNFKNYEVIVADFNSKDNTRKIARKFGCRVTRGGTPSIGRNNGARIANGELLFFLDADVILPKGFLKNMVNSFRRKKVVVATCFAIPNASNIFDYVVYFFANLIMWFLQFFTPHAPGFCIIARKDVHDRIKGFDESIILAEDHDYVKRMNKHGKFRVLNHYILFSMRRFKKYGRIIYLKSLYYSVYRLFKGELRKKMLVKYEFGKYD